MKRKTINKYLHRDIPCSHGQWVEDDFEEGKHKTICPLKNNKNTTCENCPCKAYRPNGKLHDNPIFESKKHLRKMLNFAKELEENKKWLEKYEQEQNTERK